MLEFFRSRPRLTKWLRRLAIALVVAELLYAVPANIVLATHIVDKMVNASTDDVEMHVAGGWTIWPGWVHVHDVSIRVNDTDLQAILSVEEADCNVALFPFLDRKLLVYSARASGLRYRMRHRVDAIDDTNRETVAAYPPIPGVEPPVKDPVKRARPKPPKDKYWRFEVLEGVGEGDDIWIQGFHYHGMFRGTGGFFFWPNSEVTVYPLHGGAEHGSVTFGDVDISHDVSVEVEASVGRFTMPEQKKFEQLRGLDLHATMEMTIPNGKFLKAWETDGVLPIHAVLDDAHLVANIDFHDKHFTEPTRILFTAKNAGMRESFATAEGPVQITAVGQKDGNLQVGFDTAGMGVTIPSLKNKEPWRLEKTSVRTGVHVQIDDPIAFSIAAMQGKFTIPDLDWVKDLTGGLVVAKGSVASTLEAKRSTKGTVTGAVDTKLSNVQITAGPIGMGIGGSLSTAVQTELDDAQAKAAVTQGGTQIGEINLDFPQLTLRSGSRVGSTWMKAKFPSSTVKTKPNLGVQTKGVMQLGDSKVLVVPVDAAAGPFAELAAKWILNGDATLHPSIKMDGGKWAVTLDKSHVGKVTMEGFMQSTENLPKGAFWVSAVGFTSGIEMLGGTATVVPLAKEGWLNEKRAELTK